ncbi:hypothetical protein M427DRAFT_333986 [Gonapodya prolifera JEL478]|uniref:Uncharacterized protein n=1 Tax=Gonapodya prolifera (strain JEL478) TaxID=1344416 RepID=A0A139AF28_GONPJ|nr:hypothetical protein M427DRAFT_333986 [Gonapodya prolifera JEL478]|eukprot:KXS15035.1 hypothetical protein M427DRAFT_333986 [Gonapodya prolifera JEL478]
MGEKRCGKAHLLIQIQAAATQRKSQIVISFIVCSYLFLLAPPALPLSPSFCFANVQTGNAHPCSSTHVIRQLHDHTTFILAPRSPHVTSHTQRSQVVEIQAVLPSPIPEALPQMPRSAAPPTPKEPCPCICACACTCPNPATNPIPPTVSCVIRDRLWSTDTVGRAGCAIAPDDDAVAVDGPENEEETCGGGGGAEEVVRRMGALVVVVREGMLAGEMTE